MGKPFKKELEKLYDTFEWALKQPIETLKETIFANIDQPLIAVGSGGSLSACFFAMLLFQDQGTIAKAITPLEVFYSKRFLKKVNLLFLSASGKNSDILFGLKLAIEQEPKSILTISMKEDTPLKTISNQFTNCRSFEYPIPVGKDGFLATNTLVAFFTILYKVFKNGEDIEKLIEPDHQFYQNLDSYCRLVSPQHTHTVLYGGWGLPVAVDIESKFAEASLGNIFLTDYRNFGHGRHFWFATRGKQSSIIALVTPQEEKIAEKTLALIPSNIPKLILRSDHHSSFACIDLLVKSFYVIDKVGSIQNIDPGRPHVPEFGRKLYNLKYSTFYKSKEILKGQSRAELSIVRKTRLSSINELSTNEQFYWNEKYHHFIKKISSAKYGSIVLDYDGTICSVKNRYTEPSPEIIKEVLRILEGGLIIGIATGRGKSVRESLRNVLPKKVWGNLIIGYYNGSDIGTLDEEAHPNKNIPTDESLIKIKNILNDTMLQFTSLKIDERPFQLTVLVKDKGEWINVKNLIQNILMRSGNNNIRLVESSHSLDIVVQPQASKLNLIPECKKRAIEIQVSDDVLCIGDKGQWPGNDFELLATTHSLSVDEVSIEPDTCWNISSSGLKNTNACLEYLKMISVKKHFLELKIP